MSRHYLLKKLPCFVALPCPLQITCHPYGRKASKIEIELAFWLPVHAREYRPLLFCMPFRKLFVEHAPLLPYHSVASLFPRQVCHDNQSAIGSTTVFAFT